MGVGEQGSPLAVGEFLAQQLHILLGHGGLALSRIEQEEVVIHIVHLLVVGIEVGETAQLTFTQTEVVETVLENDTGVVQTVFDDIVAGGYLFFGERYLRQVVFSFVGVVLCAVGDVVQRVLQRLGLGDGVAHLVGHFYIIAADVAHDGLVRTLPVVGILALTPLTLKSGLALVHGHLVVEIPQTTLVATVLHLLTRLLSLGGTGILRLHLGGFGLLLLAALFLLLFLQCLNHAVDGGIAVGLAHVGENLQRVLQVDGIGIGHQLVEDDGAVRQLFVVLAVAVEQTDGLAVAATGVAIFLLVPIQVAQLQQQHAFLDA